ncbi:S41 family peptidase [Planctomycetota bacterium]
MQKRSTIWVMNRTLLWVMLACLSSSVSWAEAVGADPGSTGHTDVPSEVYTRIYQGEFLEAGKLLAAMNASEPNTMPRSALQGIVDAYEVIEQRRAEGWTQAYDEHLKHLKTLQSAWEEVKAAHPDIPPVDFNDGPADPNDPNALDPNDLTSVLAVIANVSEYATDAQKQQLLQDAFVKEVFEISAARASRHEDKGKWLESYSLCYAWLKTIDPNNKAYKDYAEELIEKATIAASFEDSPCETSQERYQGVSSRTFVRAIDILDVHYVSTINYREAAVKAINRSKRLGDVVAVLPWEKIQAKSATANAEPPTSQALSAWAVALAGLQDEVEGNANQTRARDLRAVFEKVLEMNRSTVELPEEILIIQFAEATLATLDPHTNIIWPRQVEDFDKAMNNEFTGIGIEISKPKGQLTVASLLLDTPAYKAGLDAGDVIESVDDVPTKDMSLHCAVKKITGPKGTEVVLKVKREGKDEPMIVPIVRDRITVPTIRGWQRTGDGNWRYMVDEKNKIGYVRVTSFSMETAADLENTLMALEKQNMQGLILDLRWNSGGLLSSAVAITDMFIPGGLVVWTKPREGRMPDYSLAHAEGTHPNFPVVVLVNSGSASASEIVSGALADTKYERAVLVGERTHGKGSVQVITDYRLGGAHLKYTMAYYHLPSGQRVNSRDAMEKQGSKDWGVGPDVEIVLRNNELKDMLKTQKDNDVLVQAKNGHEKSINGRHSIQDTLDTDPQLAAGLLVVQAKLAQTDKLAWPVN